MSAARPPAATRGDLSFRRHGALRSPPASKEPGWKAAVAPKGQHSPGSGRGGLMAPSTAPLRGELCGGGELTPTIPPSWWGSCRES